MADVLNGSGGFIEFEPYGGERSFIAKSQIFSLKLVGVPRAGNLQQRVRNMDDFDPHQVLGVPYGTPWDEVRQAFVQRSKVYHPDRYANAALPEEVKDYLAAMARRINAAYAALEIPHQATKTAAAQRAEPIYTSQPR